MKYTKNIVLFISSIILGLLIVSCGSEDGSEDTKEEATPPETVITPIIAKPKEDTPEKPVEPETPVEPAKRGRTLNPDNKKPIIIEKNGEIRAQFEIGSLFSSWKFISADEEKFKGSREDGYITWTGPQTFGTANNGVIEYTIRITTPGEYIYRHRVNITKIDPKKPNSEHNDVWLRFPDADGFFARKSDNREKKVYPRGGSKNPPGAEFPDGASVNGFFKVFYNALAWGWAGGTSDFRGFPVSVVFDKPGDYKMQISSRSSYLGMDEFALSNKGVFNNGDNIETSEFIFKE